MPDWIGRVVFMVLWAPHQIFSVTYRIIVAVFSTFMCLHWYKLTQGTIFIKVSRIARLNIKWYGRNKFYLFKMWLCYLYETPSLQQHCIFMVVEWIVDIIFVVFSTLQLPSALLLQKSMPGRARSADSQCHCRGTFVSRTESGLNWPSCNIYSHGLNTA